jgi:NADH-quinone oxidoreductase subunit E
MSIELSEERRRRLEALLGRYPAKAAACLPVLHLVQEERGAVDEEAVRFTAELCEVPVGRVEEVATFYAMYRRRPAGRHHLEICTNLSCSLMGAEHLREALVRELGIQPGQTTKDGLFTLSEVECLASCGTAPVMQVDGEFHERLTPESLRSLIGALRAKAAGG